MVDDTSIHPTLIGHMDTLLRFYEMEPLPQPALTMPASELPFVQTFFSRGQDGHIDYPRAQEGGMAGAFFAVYVPAPKAADGERPSAASNVSPERWYESYIRPSIHYEYAQQASWQIISLLSRLEAGSQGRLMIVRTVSDLEICLQQGIMAAIMHIEGAEMIDPQLVTLDVLYQAGLRSLGPVWSRPNIFGYGVPLVVGQSPDTGPGLTDAGKALVKACNQLGIMLDLSHLNEQGFWDVARLSQAPLVATHSNAYALCPSARNLTDRQLDAIKASHGLVGINFNVYDVRTDGKGNVDTPIEDLIRHIDYLVEHVGIEGVAIGTDYDGATMPGDLRDISCLPRLYAALTARGYDEHSLRLIASENWLRIFRQTWR
ncbi:dipeptidase [Dictyobacter aurantiacus]|uniref:Membrane dipeptidase n=1 Tax=Dictyobacter aurantiacus TaxID=1936993 RepID=A0A401ZRT1_9CHLR|nr:dipeptidase [Dictyobacter aurantiacus]GCE09575.1 membrane dipeptidase [Dictyobacter aurantiacus]